MIMLILFVIGLCAGSFINALVWRLHEQMLVDNKKQKAKSKNTSSDLSVLRGRSMCPKCLHTLAWYDLIPVASWVGLRGKCRYCRKSVSVQYPLVELLMAVLFIVIYSYWPLSLVGTLRWLVLVCWLLATILFVSLIIYDLRWMLLPNKIVYPLGVVAVIAAILSLIAKSSLYSSIWQPILGIVLVGGFFAALYFVSKGQWMGFGDVRLGIVVGILLGWELGLVALIASFYIGAIVVIPVMLIKRLKGNTKIPFGPFLIVAVYVALFWGNTIINWYLHSVAHIR